MSDFVVMRHPEVIALYKENLSRTGEDKKMKFIRTTPEETKVSQ